MRLSINQILKPSNILLDTKSTNKDSLLDELCDKLLESGTISEKSSVLKGLLDREAQLTTAIDNEIAIPHVKTSGVKEPSLLFARSDKGVDYGADDGKPCRLFFLIAMPEGANNDHIDVLQKLSTLLLDNSITTSLKNTKSAEDVIKILTQSGSSNIVLDNNDNYDVVAVTACPTGIAHTYLAAVALENAAQEMGVKIKVETNGSSGVKNKLTEKDILLSQGVIVAADKSVDMDRFNGKKTYIASVGDGIKKSKYLIQSILDGKVNIYESKKGQVESSGSSRTGFYKHLMNGVSNMLPFVVGGGILIAISFMFGIKAFDPNDESFHPFAKLLMDIGGGNAFFLMVPILAGFIAMSIGDRPAFAPGVIAGLISANNGGGFLGGLIGGFLAGYLLLGIKKALSRLPESFEGLKPVLLYPLLGIFTTGVIMYQVIMPPVAFLNGEMTAFLNNLSSGNLILLGVILGGMMAVDMGGPVNKAAFTFGIAAIAAGNNAPHAAVMAGGMVPPIAIALATTFFKGLFSQEEKKAGLTCYLLGASFITEGAIPFAAARPLLIIPASIIGSAVAGGLSMFFKCTLPAPHGGIFVIPLVNNPLMYIISILIGSVITMAIIAFVLQREATKKSLV